MSPRSRLAPALWQLSALLTRDPAVSLRGITSLREFAPAAAGASLGAVRDELSPGRCRSPASVLQLHHHQRPQWRGYAASSTGKKAAVRRLRNASARAAGGRPSGPQTALQRAPTVDVQPSEGPAGAAAVAGVVNHPALIVTRPVEWGTVLLGFEQANKYVVYDQEGAVVALIAEEEGSIGRAIGRQLLKTRRPFTATVFSPDGSQVIFRLRRPAYLISSTCYIEDAEGAVVGEVHQRWHLLKRNYDLYLGQRQFAAISGGFLAWDFELKDEKGGTLALLDRNFSGFGKELFTDAGKYVLHFGSSPEAAAQEVANAVAAAHPDRPPPPPVTCLARVRTDVSVIPTSSGAQLAVARPLLLTERMIVLAAGIQIDYNYFSRHSYGGGALSPFIHAPMIPYPIPMGGGAADDAAGAAEGGDAGGGSAEGDMAPPPPPPGGEGLERDLGGDSWFGGDSDEDGGGGGDDDGGGGGFWDTLQDFTGADD